MGLWENRQGASSALVAFLVAGIVFTGSVGAVLFIGHETASSGGNLGDPTETARNELRAAALADSLVRTSGYASDAQDWLLNPDSLSTDASNQATAGRLGLLDEGTRSLSYEKFDNLQDAAFIRSADGHVNYMEARDAVGLSDFNLDFHIRAYPSLPDVYARIGTDLQHELKVTYVGAHECDNNAQSTGDCTWDMTGDDDPTPWEVSYLENIVKGFCPFEYDSTTDTPLSYAPLGWPAAGQDHAFACDAGQAGDIIPDSKNLIKSELKDRLEDVNGNPDLTKTNVLIIGSEVDHSSLQASQIENQIGPWVYEGGYLVVLGTHSTNTQWLNSLVHLGIHSSGGGVAIEDDDHPVLNVPNDLDEPSYDAQGQVWKFTGDGADSFTTVATGTGGGGPENTVMAISEPGAFGEGTMAFSSWFPYDIFGDGAGTGYDQGMAFVDNLLNLGRHRTLYLDYGPAIPEGQEALPAVARSYMDVAEEFPEYGTVVMTVLVWVFPTTAETLLAGDTPAEAPDAPPIAQIGTTCNDLTCTFDGTGSFDPDGNDAALTYSWDFGDGNTATGIAPPAHTYASAGTYAMTLTVTDEQGLTDVLSQILAVSSGAGNAAPTAVIGSLSCDVTECTFDSTGTSDPDGDDLEYLWQFGTAATSTEASGTITLPLGSHTVRLSVEDTLGASHFVEQVLDVVGQPITIDTFSTSQGTGNKLYVHWTWSADPAVETLELVMDGAFVANIDNDGSLQDYQYGKVNPDHNHADIHEWQLCYPGLVNCSAIQYAADP